MKSAKIRTLMQALSLGSTVVFVAVGLAASEKSYKAPEALVAPSAFQGVHGMGVDDAGNLFAGSVVGQSLYQVDTKTGDVKTAVGGP